MNSTDSRVPRTIGFLVRIAGSSVIRSCQPMPLSITDGMDGPRRVRSIAYPFASFAQPSFKDTVRLKTRPPGPSLESLSTQK